MRFRKDVKRHLPVLASLVHTAASSKSLISGLRRNTYCKKLKDRPLLDVNSYLWMSNNPESMYKS